LSKIEKNVQISKIDFEAKAIKKNYFDHELTGVF
jgi:hypothetical protein